MKTETITCQSCKAAFEWEHNLDADDSFHRMLKPSHCDSCQAIEEERQRQADRETRETRIRQRIGGYVEGIRAKIPPLFQKTDITHPRFNRAGWDKLKDWRPNNEKPWIGLIGETGTSKSRIAHLLALEIARDMAESHYRAHDHNDFRADPCVRLVSSYEITDAVMAQFGNKQQTVRSLWDDATPAQDARGFLDRVRVADLLLIDDIGKGRLSPAVAAELFAIVDHRYAHQLATIWTANSTPDQIATSLSEDMAAPFAGRLNDSSRIIRFKP